MREWISKEIATILLVLTLIGLAASAIWSIHRQSYKLKAAVTKPEAIAAQVDQFTVYWDPGNGNVQRFEAVGFEQLWNGAGFRVKGIDGNEYYILSGKVWAEPKTSSK